MLTSDEQVKCRPDERRVLLQCGRVIRVNKFVRGETALVTTIIMSIIII